jgi:hypothetical protein
MSVQAPESQTNFVNDINDDSVPNVTMTEPMKEVSDEEKKEMADMSYSELKKKLEKDAKEDEKDLILPLSK